MMNTYIVKVHAEIVCQVEAENESDAQGEAEASRSMLSAPDVSINIFASAGTEKIG